MKLFFSLFAAAIAAPVSAEIYFKEQFNDDVSFDVLPINSFAEWFDEKQYTWKSDFAKERDGRRPQIMRG
jgi:hypothetical protein